MTQRSLRILALFDGMTPAAADEALAKTKTEKEILKDEANLIGHLENLGHEVMTIAVHDELDEFLKTLGEKKPNLVFNLCEAYQGDRKYEPHVAGLVEMMGIPITGSGLEALSLCKDKGLTKKILSYHGIRVPEFEVSRRSRPIRSLKNFPYPAFIKPLGLEASEGIAQLSFADNEEDALKRVEFIHRKMEVDAIIEEFIDGRELYVGVLGNEKLTAFPPRELFFDETPEGEFKFATFKAKWDTNYRKRWGIRTGKPKSIDQKVMDDLLETAKKIYRLLHMRGYGRIDFRLKPNGEFVFLEANPNPSIAESEDLALAAKEGGVDYSELLDKVIRLAGA